MPATAQTASDGDRALDKARRFEAGMYQQQGMREPGQIAASVRIVEAARSAMADAMEAHEGIGWDNELLVYETARMLGSLLRSAGVVPEALDLVLRFTREVYAGVCNGRFLTVDEAIAHYCADTAAPVASATQ